MNKKKLLTIFLIFISILSNSAHAQKKAPLKKNPITNSKNSLEMLQGRWASLDDKKTFFQIEGNRQIDMYGNDILDTATIHFYDECPRQLSEGTEKKTSGKFLIVEIRPRDFYCYQIESISSKLLVLVYYPRGTFLRYKKVPAVNLAEYNSTDIETD